MSNMYTTDANGNAAVRVGTEVTGPSSSIYGVDKDGNAAIRVIGETGGGSGGASTAKDVSFDPTNLKVLKTTNVQSALSETDAALADLQDAVSILFTTVELADTIGSDTVIMLDELNAMEVDGRPSYKLPGATVFAPNGQQGIIHSVDTENQSATVKTTVTKRATGGGTNAGIKGDYFATWGWTEGDNGLPTIVSGSNNIKTPAGIVMMCPGADGYITFTGEMTYENELTEDFTLFYARNTDGTGATLVGVTDVVWSDTEPEPNGQSGFQAWKKSGSSTWQLRSNDTGNTWREVVGGPIGDVHYTDGTVTRLDFDGYRQFNKQKYIFQGTESINLGERVSSYKETRIDFIVPLATGRNAFISNSPIGTTGFNIVKSDVGINLGTTYYDGFTSGVSLTPYLNKGGTLGSPSSMFDCIYVKKIKGTSTNGEEYFINVPTTGGTMVVATPPTTAGNYVLKTTVAEDGTIATQWVAEA